MNPPIKDHGRGPPDHEGGLSNSLLLQLLNGMSAVEQRITRTETQNETILAGQARADESRATMHKRLNEIAENVAGQSAVIDAQGEALDALKPIVSMLKDAHIERTVIRRLLGKLMAAGRKGYVLGGGGAISAAVAWHQWDTLKAFVLRIVGAKVGGP